MWELLIRIYPALWVYLRPRMDTVWKSARLMGVLILGLIQAIIDFQGNLSAAWTRIIVGLLVLAFIVAQWILRPRAAIRT